MLCADVRFGLVHKFLWDRYRSIRQDLYIQGIQDHFAIGIFEEIVRFHVLCEHELSGDDQSGRLLTMTVIGLDRWKELMRVSLLVFVSQ